MIYIALAASPGMTHRAHIVLLLVLVLEFSDQPLIDKNLFIDEVIIII